MTTIPSTNCVLTSFFLNTNNSSYLGLACNKSKPIYILYYNKLLLFVLSSSADPATCGVPPHRYRFYLICTTIGTNSHDHSTRHYYYYYNYNFIFYLFLKTNTHAPRRSFSRRVQSAQNIALSLLLSIICRST